MRVILHVSIFSDLVLYSLFPTGRQLIQVQDGCNIRNLQPFSCAAIQVVAQKLRSLTALELALLQVVVSWRSGSLKHITTHTSPTAEGQA